MNSTSTTTVLDELVGPVTECLTPESARRLLAVKADPMLQARVDDWADCRVNGLLTPDESAEYGRIVAFGTFVAILKSKARQLLADNPGS